MASTSGFQMWTGRRSYALEGCLKARYDMLRKGIALPDFTQQQAAVLFHVDTHLCLPHGNTSKHPTVHSRSARNDARGNPAQSAWLRSQGAAIRSTRCGRTQRVPKYNSTYSCCTTSIHPEIKIKLPLHSQQNFDFLFFGVRFAFMGSASLP